MTLFEWLSIVTYFTQLGAILWGINEMRKSNDNRAASNELMLSMAAGIREQSAGIRAILERNQPNPSSQGG